MGGTDDERTVCIVQMSATIVGYPRLTFSFVTQPAADESAAVFAPSPASDPARHVSPADARRVCSWVPCSRWHYSSRRCCNARRSPLPDAAHPPATFIAQLRGGL